MIYHTVKYSFVKKILFQENEDAQAMNKLIDGYGSIC
jgi:hypothetical protein